MKKRRPSEVLIVEDESLTRMNAADALTEIGLRTCEAGDAREALQVLDNHPNVDLLFTDVDMPGIMNGLDLAEKVHGDWPEMELIVTSGAKGVADLDLPDDGTFLPKPYFTDRLIQIVRKKLGPEKIS
jgi:DNA-binding NtrC family response regulator